MVWEPTISRDLEASVGNVRAEAGGPTAARERRVLEPTRTGGERHDKVVTAAGSIAPRGAGGHSCTASASNEVSDDTVIRDAVVSGHGSYACACMHAAENK